jgi:hypothetical protein
VISAQKTLSPPRSSRKTIPTENPEYQVFPEYPHKNNPFNIPFSTNTTKNPTITLTTIYNKYTINIG